jgi:signal transduction histidine kinase
LGVLVGEAWEEVASVSPEPDAHLQIIESELDLTCDVDAFRIRQVFRNIFENAISASPVPTSITVEWCRANLATSPALRATVRDEGPGFTPEQRTQAFQPFYTTKVTGTGLGLTITRRIVESHGGEIEIDGDSTTGGIVVITLPQRRE